MPGLRSIFFQAVLYLAYVKLCILQEIRDFTRLDQKVCVHFCDSFGFQKVDFEPEKTQISDRFLSLAEQAKISVLLVPVGKSPIVKEIPHTYEAMKALVGRGGVDEYMPFEDCLLYTSSRQ